MILGVFCVVFILSLLGMIRVIFSFCNFCVTLLISFESDTFGVIRVIFFDSVTFGVICVIVRFCHFWCDLCDLFIPMIFVVLKTPEIVDPPQNP